jgi:hypothetical protein
MDCYKRQPASFFLRLLTVQLVNQYQGIESFHAGVVITVKVLGTDILVFGP